MRKLEALYDDIVAAGWPEPVILPLDLAKASADDFGNVATALQAQLGRVDGLVHTAALLGSLGPIEHQSFDSWLALLRVNVAAPMGLTRALMPLLSASNDASVVFTLDNRGEQPRAYWGGYAVTKAGMAALARELADEWENRPHLRINAVVPGPIRSPLRGQTHPGEDRDALPPPDALVPLYLHLLAGQAKQDSGQLLRRSTLARRRTRDIAAARVAQQHAQAPEVVGRQHVRQDPYAARAAFAVGAPARSS